MSSNLPTNAGPPDPNASALPPPLPEAPAPALPPLAGAEEVMKAIGEPMRWRALRSLADGSRPSVKELAKRLRCHSDLMGRHLTRLRKAGLVRIVRTEGADRRYHHFEVPAAYLRTLPDGRREIDYGLVALRF